MIVVGIMDFLVMRLAIVELLRKVCRWSPRVENSKWLIKHLTDRGEFKIFPLNKLKLILLYLL
jgi:hypothetical protein